MTRIKKGSGPGEVRKTGGTAFASRLSSASITSTVPSAMRHPRSRLPRVSASTPASPAASVWDTPQARPHARRRSAKGAPPGAASGVSRAAKTPGRGSQAGGGTLSALPAQVRGLLDAHQGGHGRSAHAEAIPVAPEAGGRRTKVLGAVTTR